MIGDSDDEFNFPHELLLTDTEVLRHYKAFAHNSSANIMLLTSQVSQVVQLGGGFIPLPLKLMKFFQNLKKTLKNLLKMQDLIF